jgi:hypothetical protein
MIVDETILALAGVEIEGLKTGDSGIGIVARTQQRPVVCHACNEASGRVHSYYCRQPADLPIGGRPGRPQLIDPFVEYLTQR